MLLRCPPGRGVSAPNGTYLPNHIARHFGKREIFGNMGLEAEAYPLMEIEAKMSRLSQ